MEPLTFARYILETALLEYDLIDVRDSMMAAACLLLAMTLKGTKNAWTPVLVHYTGYSFSDLFDLTYRIHAALGNVPAQFKTIKTKYSHK
jgi:G2/mitotic-specific cyclin-B3